MNVGSVGVRKCLDPVEVILWANGFNFSYYCTKTKS